MEKPKQLESTSESISTISTQSQQPVKSNYNFAYTQLDAEEQKIRYEKAQESIKETQKICEDTLNRLDKTLGTIHTTMESITETNQKYDAFKSAFEKVINSLANQIGGSMLPAWSSNNPLLGKPVEGSIADAIKILSDKSCIVFLTGAGISVASEIPTYRGLAAAEKFQKNGVKYENEEIATVKFMNEHPDLFYERTYGFLDLANSKKPNVSHYAIAKLQKFYLTQYKKVNFTLITQNIDDFHVQAYTEMMSEVQSPKQTEISIEDSKESDTKSTSDSSSISQARKSKVYSKPKQFGQQNIQSSKKSTTQQQKKDAQKPKKQVAITKSKQAEKKKEEKKSEVSISQSNKKIEPYLDPNSDQFGFCPEVFEVHGNCKYMRCNQECTQRLFLLQKPKEFVPPICPLCKKEGRPHILYFDEAYNEKYYKQDTIYKRIEKMDCIILTGSTLQTGFASKLISKAVENYIPVIEISNTQIVITGKNGMHIKGRSENIIPELCDQLMKSYKKQTQ